MKWVTIKTYPFPHLAQVDKLKLESEGINVFLKNELVQQTYNSLGPSGVELQVQEQDLPLAIETIDHLEIINIDEVLHSKLCPECGSSNIHPKKTILGKLLHQLIFGLTNLSTSKKFHCFDCGNSFKQDEIKQNRT